MNFNVFPSSILSGVRVSKGPTAIAPESGLAGQVDLQTIRPLELSQLDNKNYFGLVSYKYEHRDLADDNGGVLEGSFAWKNDQDTFGFFLGAVSGESDLTTEQFSQTRYLKNLRVDNDGDGIQDELIEGVNVPSINTSRPNKQTISRQAYSAGLQWRPSEEVDIVWDVTSTTFEHESQRHNGQMIMNPVWGGTVFDVNGIEIDENNTLQYADFSQTTGGGKILSRMHDQRFVNDTENFISGINVNWMQDNLTTNVDVYYSSVEYSQDLRFPIFNKAIDKTQVIYDGRGAVPTFTTGGDRTDPTGYAYLFTNIRVIALEAKNYGATLKFNYELDMNWLSTVDFGVHYEKTDLESTRSAVKRATATAAQKPDIVATAISGELTPGSFLADENFLPENWLVTDLHAVGAITPDVYMTGMDNLGIAYDASHNSTEEVFALFGQLNIDAELPLTGNIGLRAVQTTNEATAFTVGTDPEAVANKTDNNYWQYLPSVNLNLALSDNMALRFGFSKTLSRPEYSVMAPIIDAVLPVCQPEELPEDCKGTAKAGNPELDPMTSLNYDITFEYYNEIDGAAVVSLFYKDVSDFIIVDNSYSQTLVGQPEDVLFDLETPINFSDGEAKGFEIGFYQLFDKLIPALAGFGMSENYTRVESEFDEDIGDSGFGFPGSSENNFNFVGFYENDLFSVRLAYVYRDDFFRSLAGIGSQTDDARFTGDSEMLDLNVKVRPIDNLTLSFNAQNLLDDNRRDHVGDEGKFLDFFETGRVYSVTASYRF
jgi:iron complex outermembrane receptor protein